MRCPYCGASYELEKFSVKEKHCNTGERYKCLRCEKVFKLTYLGDLSGWV